MILPQKLTFQLTPLLDLLLIVIFAQYMEMQNVSELESSSSTEQLAQAEQKLSATADDLRKALDDHKHSVAELNSAQRRFTEISSESRKSKDDFARQKFELEEALKLAMQQRDLVGKLVVELFQLPEQSIQDVVRRRMQDEPFLTPEQLDKLLKQFRELSRQRGSQVVRHLLTYEELRKRCDIWDVYVADNGKTILTANDRTHEFRAKSPDDFAEQMFARYKALPQPKSLVIILLSHGNLKLATHDAATIGLTMATERMRADSNGRSRFEYANLGYESADDHNSPR